MPVVLIFQRTFEHYRLPVFRLLSSRLSSVGDIAVASPITNESQLQDLSLPYETYNLEVSTYGIAGQEYIHRYRNWENLLFKVRPKVVIAEGVPRIVSLYSMLNLARDRNMRTIAWTKYDNTGSWPKSWIWKDFLSRWDGIVCYGKSSYNGLKDMGLSDNQLDIAQNSVEFPESEEELNNLKSVSWSERRRYFSDNRPLVVSLGTLVKKKRFDLVIDAALELFAKGRYFRLVVVGGGPEYLSLREYAALSLKAAGLDDNLIVFIGRVPDGYDQVWLSAADVSVMGGAVGLAMNVSMGCGTATIIADETGSDSEMLVDEVNGLRFVPNDHYSLANRIDRILLDEKMRDAISVSARRDILANATVGKMVDGLEKAIAL